jgi:hypothetical protein
MYIFQAALIGGLLSWVSRQEALIVRLQVVIWTFGVIAIAWQLGLSEQVGFYSNDQSWYTETVSYYAKFGLPDISDRWLGKKVPFTFIALPLAMMGVHPTLALKTVSLVCLLVLTRSVLDASRPRTQKEQVITLWLTACGSIGSFFSLLALRENMMMLCVYRFATSESQAVRGISLIALYLLRPHLAAAVFTAEVVMVAWRWMRAKVSLGAAETPSLIAVGVILGTMLFSWGVGSSSNLRTPFSGGWGIPQAVRVASNFIGLQFLTVPEDTVNYSLTLLLLLRIVLNETIVIPVAFTAVCLFLFHHLNDRARFTLLAFTIYCSVVIGTDFNSFRQNIPFMPLMGLVVLNVIRSRNADSLPEPVDSGLPHSPSVTPRGT